ncbi:Uncharacterised protein [Chlamydia abortus]|nr:Uncharacterised protein [Chlamydia abortus]SGA23050.1 Uncharacterised protein [Chlamydia abortus]SGA31545.1 Uncharacterised protein [Chlamydia abortus]
MTFQGRKRPISGREVVVFSGRKRLTLGRRGGICGYNLLPPGEELYFGKEKPYFGEKSGHIIFGAENGIVLKTCGTESNTPSFCDCAPQVLFRGRQNYI